VRAANDGNRVKKAHKRESKQKLCALFQQLVVYFNLVSDGRLSLLYSSGFRVLTEKCKGQIPNPPTAPFLSDGRTSEEVAFGFKPIGRDMFYDYRFAANVDSTGLPQWEEIAYKTTLSRLIKVDSHQASIFTFKLEPAMNMGIVTGQRQYFLWSDNTNAFSALS
jgi:hypothetical protein